jgi:glycerol-3-phosphate acyltransferase PlsY
MDMLVPAVLAGSYLLGAVPFGLLFSRFLGNVDVRTVGSGNIGATNVLRAAGKSAAILTLLADALKGVLPVLVAARAFPGTAVPALAGIASILGHDFPVYLRFKGGKGVATGFGVVLAMSPWTGLACLLVWLASALIWRYSSLAALVAFAFYPAAVFVARTGERPEEFLSLVLFALIYIRHRENIKRLLAGREPKIGQKR